MQPNGNGKDKDPGSGRFLVGHKLGQEGRPKGAHNKIPSQLRNAIIDAAVNIGNILAKFDKELLDGNLSKDFEILNDNKLRKSLKLPDGALLFGPDVLTGSQGLPRYLEHLAVWDKQSFVRLLGRLLPKQMKLDVDGEVTISHQEALRRVFKILDLKPDEVPAFLTSAEEDSGDGEGED